MTINTYEYELPGTPGRYSSFPIVEGEDCDDVLDSIRVNLGLLREAFPDETVTLREAMEFQRTLMLSRLATDLYGLRRDWLNEIEERREEASERERDEAARLRRIHSSQYWD